MSAASGRRAFVAGAAAVLLCAACGSSTSRLSEATSTSASGPAVATLGSVGASATTAPTAAPPSSTAPETAVQQPGVLLPPSSSSSVAPTVQTTVTVVAPTTTAPTPPTTPPPPTSTSAPPVTPTTSVADAELASAQDAVATFYANATSTGDLSLAYATLTPSRQQHFVSFTHFSCVWGQFTNITIDHVTTDLVSPNEVAVSFVASYSFAGGTTAVEDVTSDVIVSPAAALINTETSTRVSGNGHASACP